MSYLISQLWLFLLLGAVLGLLVGWWAACSRADCDQGGNCASRGKLVFWLVLLAALIGAVIALSKSIAGRYGFYLEITLLLLAAYIVGCILGCLIGRLFCRTSSVGTGTSHFVSAANAGGTAIAGGVAGAVKTVSDTGTAAVDTAVKVAETAKADVTQGAIDAGAAVSGAVEQVPSVAAPAVDAAARAPASLVEAVKADVEAPVVAVEPVAAPAAAVEPVVAPVVDVAPVQVSDVKIADFDADPNVLAAKPVGLAAPQGGTKDDLKRIRGIGRVNEARLNDLGIFHFDQIAAWQPEQCKWVNQLLAFPGRIQREDWVGQAKVLSTGGETSFSRRVDKGDVPTSI